MSCPDRLAHVVPRPADPVTRLTPLIIVVHAIPTLLTAAVWIAVERRTRRVAAPADVRLLARTWVAAAVGVAALLTWSVTERAIDTLSANGSSVLSANDSSVPSANACTFWPIIFAVANVLLGIAVLVVSTRFSRAAILVALCTAAGVVIVDAGLRGWWVESDAAAPLVAVEQLWCTVAASLLVTLPRRGAIAALTTARTSATAPPVDPLARPVETTTTMTPQWTWFL